MILYDNTGVHMAIEKVREYFEKLGIADRILEFDVSSATVELAAKAIRRSRAQLSKRRRPASFIFVELAAKALGCEPRRIAKTLSFMLEDSAILIVAAGDAKVDNPKYKAEFGKKAKMLTADEVVQLTGHAIGGVCPFAVNDGVKVYLDVSLKRFETIFPACGSSNSAIELTTEELEKYSGFTKWVDVCKAWE